MGIREYKRREKYSDKFLEAVFHRLREELGRVPSVDEYPYSSCIYIRYGKYTEFVKRMGYIPLGRALVTDEILEDSFNKLVEKLGKTPTQKQFLYGGVAVERHGNYSNFVKFMGKKPNQIFLTDEDLINAFFKKCAELGRVPYSKEFAHPHIVHSRYGTYNKFVEQMDKCPAHVKYAYLTKEALLEIYIESCNKVGRWIQSRELFKLSGYGASVYEIRFKTISDLREDAINAGKVTFDQPINRRLTLYPTEFLETIIREFFHGNKDATYKQFMQYIADRGYPNATTFSNRIGSFAVMKEKYR